MPSAEKNSVVAEGYFVGHVVESGSEMYLTLAVEVFSAAVTDLRVYAWIEPIAGWCASVERM